jgi:hypothetical protein
MKKTITILPFITITIVIQFFFSLSLFAQNVGINTETPQARLHIFKASSGYVGVYPHQDLIIESNDHTWINLLAPNDKEMGLLFGKPSNIASGGIVYDINNNMQFRTNGNINRMFIGSNGNVGIGSTAPNAPLGFPPLLGGKITFYPGSGGDIGLGVQANLLQIYTDYAGADIAFGYGNSNSFAEKMRIKGNGKVGIGTSNPSATLDVKGNIQATEYDFPTPQTFYYSIPASAFTPTSSTASTLYKENISTGGGASFADGKNEMVAPVNLPHLATVNQITVFYKDISFTFDIHVSLYRKNDYDNYELMGEFGSQFQPGSSSAVVNSINHPMINNSTYNYHIRVYSTAYGDPNVEWWPGFDLEIKSIVIRYTLSSAQ